jgi:hypothetical protein
VRNVLEIRKQTVLRVTCEELEATIADKFGVGFDFSDEEVTNGCVLYEKVDGTSPIGNGSVGGWTRVDAAVVEDFKNGTTYPGGRWLMNMLVSLGISPPGDYLIDAQLDDPRPVFVL